jgi:hypothetical protein
MQTADLSVMMDVRYLFSNICRFLFIVSESIKELSMSIDALAFKVER